MCVEESVSQRKKTNNKIISVIITTYNRSSMIENAIRSVFEQTYKEYELHIIDDASTDNTQEVVKPLIARIKNAFYWRHDINQGLAYARNTGISKSKGMYATFLDDDDIWLPERLEVQINAAEKMGLEYGAFYCGSARYLQDGRLQESVPWLRGSIMEALLKGWTPPCSASLFRRDALEKIGGFDKNVKSGVDHDIWFAIGAAGYKFDYVPRGLVITNPLQHKMKRITTCHGTRISGIEVLCQKWRKKIEECIGHKGYMRFRRRYIAREFYSIAFKDIQTYQTTYVDVIKLLIKSLIYYPGNKNAWGLLFAWAIGRNSGVEQILFLRNLIRKKKPGEADIQSIRQNLGIPGL